MSYKVTSKLSNIRRFELTNISSNGAGNFFIGDLPAINGEATIVVCYAPNSIAYDGLYTPFFSSTARHWYCHVATWQGASANNVRVDGYVYYAPYKG